MPCLARPLRRQERLPCSSLTVIAGAVTQRWDNASGLIDTASIEDGAINVAAIICDSVASVGAVSGTTLSASGAATMSSSFTVIGSGVTQRWDNASGKIDTAALEDGAIDVAAVTCDSVLNAGSFTTTPVANANVTNGQAVTLSGVINLLTGTGGAASATNTITIANPSAAGQWAILYNAAAATNNIAIAKTGNFDGPALDLGAGESAIIFAPASTNWAGIGQ